MFSWLSFSAFAEEMIIKTSDGVELFVSVKGEGVPCVYMHGGPGSGAYWLEYFSGDILESKFKMIYVDQRGVSRSTSPANGDFSVNRMVKDFEEVREALGIEKWLTLGYYFGGILQMAYAEAYPNAQAGMLMVNCTIDFDSSVDNFIDFGLKELGIQDSAYYREVTVNKVERAGSLISQMIKKDVFWKLHYSEEANFHMMAEVMSTIKDWNGDFGWAALQIPDYFRNFKPLAKEINVPVLFIYGKYDSVIGEEHYKGINFPNMLLHEAACKHVPFMECEDELDKAIKDYLHKYQAVLSF